MQHLRSLAAVRLEDTVLEEDPPTNKTLPLIKSSRFTCDKKVNSSICLSSLSQLKSIRNSKSPSPSNSQVSRLYDLTSSAQNKLKPGICSSFRTKLRQWKTGKGKSFKLKCSTVSKEGCPSKGLANIKISLNLRESIFGKDPDIGPIPDTEEIVDEGQKKDDLNDSDLINLEGLRESLTLKKALPKLSREKMINESRDSGDE
jgi:hypothetical protein